MIRALVFFTLAFVTTSASAQEFPRFDVDAICRAAPRLISTDPNPYSSCVRDETYARGQLERQWTSFNAQVRETCVRDTSVGGFPSFVDVLTCIQVAGGVPPLYPPVLRQ